MTSQNPLKRISQQTFDETVQENMEEFDMGREEAIADAIKQFESQGIDLTNILKGVDLPASEEGAEVVKLFRSIEEELSGEKTHPESVLANFTRIQELMQGEGLNKDVAGRNGGVEICLMAIQAEPTEIINAGLNTLRQLIAGHPVNRNFIRQEGIETIGNLLWSTDIGEDLAGSGFQALRQAFIRSEENKVFFRKTRGVALFLRYIKENSLKADLLTDACAALRAFCVNDDPSAQMGGQANEVIKELIADSALDFLLQALRRNATERKAEIAFLTQCTLALKQLVTTQESCRLVVEAGGLDVILSVLKDYGAASPSVARACISLLRNIAGNDEFKTLLVSSGALSMILAQMQTHSTDAGVQEVSCAAIAAIALRKPSNCETIVNAGAISLIVRAIERYQQDENVLRQACIAIRNVTVRNPELRPLVLEEGVEELLRPLQAYPVCGEFAYAALRDMGCEVRLASIGGKGPTNFNPTFQTSNDLEDAIEREQHAPFASV